MLIECRIGMRRQTRGQRRSQALGLDHRSPRHGFIDRSRVSRHNFSQRLIVGRDTANCFTTSSRGVPRLSAATTRQRKSSE
jgi:hypothetical protein